MIASRPTMMALDTSAGRSRGPAVLAVAQVWAGLEEQGEIRRCSQKDAQEELVERASIFPVK